MPTEIQGRSAGCAPVALFCYDRPRHLMQVLEALARNAEASETDLFVFSDGPRDADAAVRVDEVRAVARSAGGFRNVEVVARPSNLGVAGSVIAGTTEVVGRAGRVIVLEDDLVPSPNFLRYLNDALERYEHEERVISAHAYCYPVRGRLPPTFFLRGADCWGWGTWRRGWELFQSDGRALLDDIERRNLTREFDFDGSYPYTQMLRDNCEGRTDSWAIRWYASAFVEDKLTLYPGSSLVQNIGADASGTHLARTDAFRHRDWGAPVPVEEIAIEESPQARALFAQYLRGLGGFRPGVILERLLRLLPLSRVL